MNRNFLRDYTIEAFRHWTELGKPSYDDLKEKYTKDVSFRRRNNSNHKREMMASLEDVKAIEKTLEELKKNYAAGTSECVLAVYGRPERPGDKDGIRERAINYSATQYISERSVYRMLEDAHHVFGSFRGLRCGY